MKTDDKILLTVAAVQLALGAAMATAGGYIAWLVVKALLKYTGGAA